MPNDEDENSPRTKNAADELPPADTKRWTLRCKAAIVEAMLSGEITIEEVCRRYDLTVEEFFSWRNMMDRTQCAGFAHHQALELPPFPPETGLRRRSAVTGAVNEFRGSRESAGCRGRDVMRGFTPHRRSTIRTGDLVVDLETHIVSADGKPMPLTGKEYRIFELVSLRKGAIVTKGMLLDHLYRGMDAPKRKIIDVFVCHLRKKLTRATGGKHYIETVWGRGYRMRDPGQVSSLLRP